MEEFSRAQCRKQADDQLQDKGLRRAGDISTGQVGHGQAHRAGKAAPAAQKQSADDDKGVAQMDGGTFGSYRYINA